MEYENIVVKYALVARKVGIDFRNLLKDKSGKSNKENVSVFI